MILTELADPQAAIAIYAGHLAAQPLAAACFARIAASRSHGGLAGEDNAANRQIWVQIAEAYGIATLDEEPARFLSWDGRVLRTRSEPWVLAHEVAHWLLCPPGLRHLPDFGLGAGPESGARRVANAAIALSREERLWEEALASLLGILLQVEAGQDGFAAFLEQNWMEGFERPSAADHFVGVLADLQRRGTVDGDGRPFPPQHWQCTA